MRPEKLSGAERAAYVQAMFARIAKRYDLMNRLMTAGQDIRWRQQVVQQAGIPTDGRVLDLGTGTGDLADEVHRQLPHSQVVAADFTINMMYAGKTRRAPNQFQPGWCAADALHLPFTDRAFDAVISGFLMRNVGSLDQALHEQRRVLKPGGRIVILDTTRPQPNLLTPFIRFHLHVVIPALGQLISGSREAYRYLPDSTAGFLSAEELADRLKQAGFEQIGFQRQMLGTIAIHWAEKPHG
jgi:demethylmenaquinone methyltransferase/2-methoxy-6-polyprenyl-1,4-benzoquinol methylase